MVQVHGLGSYLGMVCEFQTSGWYKKLTRGKLNGLVYCVGSSEIIGLNSKLPVYIGRHKSASKRGWLLV